MGSEMKSELDVDGVSLTVCCIQRTGTGQQDSTWFSCNCAVLSSLSFLVTWRELGLARLFYICSLFLLRESQHSSHSLWKLVTLEGSSWIFSFPLLFMVTSTVGRNF